MRFDKKYGCIFLALLAAEVVIARYAHDRLIRPYGGDFLVVILLYSLVRAFWKGRVLYQALGVLLFAYFVEGTQYFRLADRLGVARYPTARLILGTSFAWGDILAYSLGIALVYGLETAFRQGAR